MARIVVTDREGQVHEVEGELGAPLMYTLRELDYGVEAICGGVCSCATCHVYVAEDWLGQLPPRDDEEAELVEELEHHRATSRLSCQVEFTPALDGLRVTIAPEE